MILLPEHIPSAASLLSEGYDVAEFPMSSVCQGSQPQSPSAEVAETGSPLRIALLNLMPEKEQALMDICRVLDFSDCVVQIVPLKFRGRTYKVAPQEYMEQFYTDVEDIAPSDFNALLVNGAPVEKLPFEQVDYWTTLCSLMDAFSVRRMPQLYICWAAQAALYHFYGVPKYLLTEKRFGIFRHDVSADFMQSWGIAEKELFFPVSRHTEVRAADIAAHPTLAVAASSDESGVGIVTDESTRRTFITAHSEYGRERLGVEYRRDVGRGLPIHVPEHYFQDDDPQKPVVAEWHDGARAVFRAWLHQVDSLRR